MSSKFYNKKCRKLVFSDVKLEIFPNTVFASCYERSNVWNKNTFILQFFFTFCWQRMKLKNNNLFNHLQFDSGALNVIWTFLFFQQFCNKKWRTFYHVTTDTCNGYQWYNFTLNFPENDLQKYWKPLKQEPFEDAYPHIPSDLNFLPAVYIFKDGDGECKGRKAQRRLWQAFFQTELDLCVFSAQ